MRTRSCSAWSQKLFLSHSSQIRPRRYFASEALSLSLDTPYLGTLIISTISLRLFIVPLSIQWRRIAERIKPFDVVPLQRKRIISDSKSDTEAKAQALSEYYKQLKKRDDSGLKPSSYMKPFILQNALTAMWFGYMYKICAEVEGGSWKYSVLHEMSALTQNVGLIDPYYAGAIGMLGLSIFNMSYLYPRECPARFRSILSYSRVIPLIGIPLIYPHVPVAIVISNLTTLLTSSLICAVIQSLTIRSRWLQLPNTVNKRGTLNGVSGSASTQKRNTS